MIPPSPSAVISGGGVSAPSSDTNDTAEIAVSGEIRPEDSKLQGKPSDHIRLIAAIASNLLLKDANASKVMSRLGGVFSAWVVTTSISKSRSESLLKRLVK